MSSVVKRAAKYGGSCLALALVSGKILGPLIGQLQKRKTEEIISDERYEHELIIHFSILIFFSIIRRFEQALVEGGSRFTEESAFLSELIKNYFNIEGLAERLRTCRQEEKRELWNDMKTLGNAYRRIQRDQPLFSSFCASFSERLSQLYGFDIKQSGNGHNREIFNHKLKHEG